MTTETQAAGSELTIGDLAARTGLTPAVLRMWETRHGFPVPHRLPSGHRRYAEDQVDLVLQVLRRRDAGVRLDVAIAEARAGVGPGTDSVYAEIRRRHPGLASYRLKKSTLIALSWGLEDDFLARADRPILFGGFQEARFFAPSAARWQELARVARSAMVLGDFPDPEGFPTDGPVPVPLAGDAPMRREWVVVCDASEVAACLAAWELPGQAEVPDRSRIFEAIWTVDPRAVRDAARVCATVASSAGVAGADAVLGALADEPPHLVPDIAGATALLNRVVAYVDRFSS